MPALLEAEHIDIEVERALDIGNVEDGTRVPSVKRLAARSLLRHVHLLSCLTPIAPPLHRPSSPITHECACTKKQPEPGSGDTSGTYHSSPVRSPWICH